MGSEDRRGIILFVHGFGSSSACWAPLLSLLAGDEAVTSRYELRTWDYPTKWIELSILGRIPGLPELGRSLGDEIDSPAYRGRPLTLVGHSQGGLVILSYFAELLQRGEASRLAAVRQAICLATPCEGSRRAMALRTLVSTLFHNPQEVTLRSLNPDVSALCRVIRNRVVTATADTDTSRRIPIHAVCGLQDNIVSEASARGPFESLRHVPGDHSTIVRPRDRHDRRYTELVELFLDPGGHLHRFEVEQDETVVRVEPRARQTMLAAGDGHPRTFELDNFATVRRTVTFAASNECRRPFSIRYDTPADAHVVSHESHPNEAPASEIRGGEPGRGFHRFDFTPEDGQEYCLNAEVYQGFGAGHRHLHVHLGDHSHYRRLVYELDLSCYVAAGYRVLDGPHLYLRTDDAPHGRLCGSRGVRDPYPPVSTLGGGVYRWQLEGIQSGVVDIAWDVAACAATTPVVTSHWSEMDLVVAV